MPFNGLRQALEEAISKKEHLLNSADEKENDEGE